jgi:superfamily I DNA/RNA helicase
MENVNHKKRQRQRDDDEDDSEIKDFNDYKKSKRNDSISTDYEDLDNEIIADFRQQEKFEIEEQHENKEIEVEEKAVEIARRIIRYSDPQRKFIECPYAGQKKVIAVESSPGSGKTTTIYAFIENNKQRRILYLVFNVSMSRESLEIMKVCENVDVATFAALAYKWVVKKHNYQLLAEQPDWERVAVSKLEERFLTHFNDVVMENLMRGLENYFHSADQKLELKHFQHLYPAAICNLKPEVREKLPNASYCVLWGTQLINWMITQCVPLNLEMMVKLLHLQQPRLEEEYSVCIIDEAQDLIPVVLDLLHPASHPDTGMRGRDWTLYVVGDRYQQINTHFGTSNAMEMKDIDLTYSLTKSFRFGTNVANLRNGMFYLIGLELFPVEGSADKNTSVFPFGFIKYEDGRELYPHYKHALNYSMDDVEELNIGNGGDPSMKELTLNGIKYYDHRELEPKISVNEDPSSQEENNLLLFVQQLKAELEKKKYYVWNDVKGFLSDAFQVPVNETLDQFKHPISILARANASLISILANSLFHLIDTKQINYILSPALKSYIQKILYFYSFTPRALNFSYSRSLTFKFKHKLQYIFYVKKHPVSHVVILKKLLDQSYTGEYSSKMQFDKPTFYLTTSHSSKGLEFQDGIVSDDLQDNLFKSLDIKLKNFDILQTPAAIDHFLKKYRENLKERKIDKPSLFNVGVAITRQIKRMTIPLFFYQVYESFMRNQPQLLLPAASAPDPVQIA